MFGMCTENVFLNDCLTGVGERYFFLRCCTTLKAKKKTSGRVFLYTDDGNSEDMSLNIIPLFLPVYTHSTSNCLKLFLWEQHTGLKLDSWRWTRATGSSWRSTSRKCCRQASSYPGSTSTEAKAGCIWHESSWQLNQWNLVPLTAICYLDDATVGHRSDLYGIIIINISLILQSFWAFWFMYTKKNENQITKTFQTEGFLLQQLDTSEKKERKAR